MKAPLKNNCSYQEADGTTLQDSDNGRYGEGIILDDFGLQPLSQEIRLTLLQLLEDRYGKKSILVTSQLPVSKWYEYINEPTLADAIMDRLTANACRIELKGESLRRKKLKSAE